MMWTKENMFEPSGCLTREAFEALVNHQLPADAKALADEHVASCPFCSDALEGFTTDEQKIEFVTLMDKADKGFDEIRAKTQTKSTKRRTLWITISAAASILMLVGLFLLMNQPQTKNQMAQSLPKDTTINRTKEEIKPLAEPTEKAKQAATETKAKPPAPEKKIARSVQPEIAKSEDVSTNTTDAVAVETQTNAPVAATAASEEKMVVAEEALKKDFKEKEANKTISNGSYVNAKPAENKALRKVSADKITYKSPFKDTSDDTQSGYEFKNSNTKTSKTKQTSEPEPAAFVEKMPEYPGGDEAMRKFISNNLMYPKVASEMGVSGRVYVQFMVDGDGYITNVKVLRGIGGGCDEEAVRIVKLMPKWIPGRSNGKAAPVFFTLPIQFSLQK